MSLHRISKEKKELYNSIVKEFKEQANITVKKAKKFEQDGRKGDDTNAFYKRIAAASAYLNTVGLYCEMNRKSVEIMSIKSELYLGNARKNIYQAIKILESVVGEDIDSSLTESSEILDKLTFLNPRRILNLMKKFDYTIALVEYAEGETSRFKWNFTELFGKASALCKNMINFKKYAHDSHDPRAKYYTEINDLLSLVKKTANDAANKYRNKYELSTRDISDMTRAIDFLNLLVRVHIVLNEQTSAQTAKKTIEKWKAKQEQDLKKKDEEAKKQMKNKARKR